MSEEKYCTARLLGTHTFNEITVELNALHNEVWIIARVEG